MHQMPRQSPAVTGGVLSFFVLLHFRSLLSLYRGPPATRDKHDYCENQADNEQNPRDVRGCSRNSATAENSGNERYDQKSNRPTNHLLSPVSEWDAWL